ncbi:OmpA family protein [Labilibaculum sp.]|uniref:OmpA family protein n=1 Tax=Labilibaculum sp. TaxID=2060723 RepID=UPI0035696005
MKKIATIILFIGILSTSFSVNAQMLERANKYFESFSYQEAIELYEILWEKDSLNENVSKQLATSYRMINNSEKSELWYARLVHSNIATSNDYLYYARALQSNKKYEEAKIWMDKYQKSTSISNFESIRPKQISDLKKDSSRYRVEPISANSEQSDFGAAYYKNEIVFSSAKERSSIIKRNYKWNNQNYLRLYKAEVMQNGDLNNPKLFSGKLETNYHDGPVCFTADGNEMFLTRNNVSSSKRAKRDGEGVVNIQLYHCKKEGNKWSKPELLPLNLEEYSTGHPALSDDGNSLYFISDRPGGFGGTDLYVATKTVSGWSNPKNLGEHINTSENEMFPFVTGDKLFFASKGHYGLGGLDVFTIDLKQENAKPVNMGFPINTSKDDFGLILKNGEGYFASNRLKGETYDDIYHFAIVSRLLKGQVFNAETKEILGNSKVSLLDDQGEVLESIDTKENGKFEFMISKVADYKIESVKEGFSNGLETVLAVNLQNTVEYNLSVYQMPIPKVETKKDLLVQSGMVLENIYYDLDKSNIRKDAAEELDKLALLMIEYPDLKIELSSHTDSRASDAYNMALSERRAKAAVEYIVSKGISSDRLKAKGYGETKLINHCTNGVKCSKAEHQANRRTEVKVLEQY